MTSKDFVYWLQGFFEISTDPQQEITPQQLDILKKHLNLVFYHEIDPSYTDDKEKQNIMTALHAGKDPAEFAGIDAKVMPDHSQYPKNKELYRC